MDVKITPPESSAAHEKKMRQLIKVSPQCVDKKDKTAKRVAGEFEALFVGLMLKSMRGAGRGDSLADGGKGGEMYRSLLDQEYARAVAESGSLGLAKVIEKELVRVSVGRGVEQTDTGSLQVLDHEERRGPHHEDRQR